MKSVISVLFFSAFLILSCNHQSSKSNVKISETTDKQLPYLTFKDAELFPGNGSLLRAEDGVFLDDGRIVVVDQATGLRIIEENGSNRPFGDFKNVGFVHNPPEKVAGPNGLVMEQDGKHLLMCDVSDGKIYRTNIETEKVQLIHDHPYGINAIYSDKTGAIWFTQCAKNTNYAEMFMEINSPGPNGAVFRISKQNNTAELIKDSLYFANGITMDKAEKKLFVSETMMDRVHSFEIDIQSGKTEYSGVEAYVGTPDNILVDNQGRLIVASPVNNQVIGIDFKNHSHHIIFNASTKENQKITNEWFRRSHLGLNFGDLFSPKLYLPLPGLITGMFFSSDESTLYIANLGNDLLKLEYN